jgi:hypothetical protein
MPKTAKVLMPSQQMLARRVAADAYESSAGDLTKFKTAVLEDIRLDGCEPDELDAIVAASGECFAYWKAEGIDTPTATVEAIPVSIVVSSPKSEPV